MLGKILKIKDGTKMQFLGKKVEIDENGDEVVYLAFVDDEGNLQKQLIDIV